MENVLLVLTLISCLALIVSVLLQRSEGGALGMGGGGGGVMSGRGAANSLVRATMVLAAVFFVSCLALTRIAHERAQGNSDIVRTIEESEADPFSGETEELPAGSESLPAPVETNPFAEPAEPQTPDVSLDEESPAESSGSPE